MKRVNTKKPFLQIFKSYFTKPYSTYVCRYTCAHIYSYTYTVFKINVKSLIHTKFTCHFPQAFTLIEKDLERALTSNQSLHSNIKPHNWKGNKGKPHQLLTFPTSIIDPYHESKDQNHSFEPVKKQSASHCLISGVSSPQRSWCETDLFTRC